MGVMSTPEIVCIGEILWDSLPAGLFLGGAPLNAARHLHAQGIATRMVSRVGTDRLGEEAVERLAREGMRTDLIQVDAALPTGFVKVTLDALGTAEYDILRPVAWDAIEPADELMEGAAQAAMIVFGTLAQRSLITRYTIERLWQMDTLRVYDVNLRPPYEEPETVRRSLGHADVVKCNEHELARIGAWYGWPAGCRESAARLAGTFGCRMVCVTRGEDGAALWHRGEWTEHPGFEVPVRDTVGTGDAFLAGLLAGLLREEPDFELLRRANLLGAWVATQNGAVPPYDDDKIHSIAERSGGRRRSPVAPGAR
jgi:fructokinase